jgi:hypothetical protein
LLKVLERPEIPLHTNGSESWSTALGLSNRHHSLGLGLDPWEP